MKSFLHNKIAWSSLVQLLGKGVQIGLGIVSVKLITSTLQTEEYGLYGKVSEYALFFSTAANLGIFGNTVRKLSEHPKNGTWFFNALMVRMGTAFLFFLAGALYAYLWIPDRAFFLGSLFFMASLFCDYITNICDAFLQANYKMGRAMLALILGRGLSLLTLLLLIKLNVESAPLFFAGPLIGAAGTALLSLLIVRQQIKWPWRMDASLLKFFLLSALPFGIINIVNNLYYRFLPSYFMAKVLSDSEYGVYNLSLHIASTASLLSTFIMFSSLPELKQDLRAGKLEKAKALFKTLEKSLLFFGLLMVGSGTFLAPLALEWLGTKDFILPELWFVLPMLLILSAVSYFYDLILITLFALEKEIWLLKREGFTLIIGFLLLFLSIQGTTTPLQSFFLLSSTLATESFITLLGLRKIKKLL